MSPQILPLRDDRLTWSAYLLLVCVLAFLCFAGLVDHRLDTDDPEWLQDVATLDENFAKILSPDLNFPGRPTVHLFLWAGYALWGARPGPFHLLVVIIHVLASLLLVLVCRHLGAGPELSFLSGLLFLVNLAHFRAVHWIAGIAYPLTLGGGLLGVLCFLRYLECRSRFWLAGLYGALLAAVLAHTSAAPVWLFCAYLAWQKREKTKTIVFNLVPLGLLVAVAIFTIVHFYAQTPQVAQTVRSVDLPYLLRHFLFFWSRLFTTAHGFLVPLYASQDWEMAVGGLAFLGFLFVLYRRTFPVTEWAIWALLTTLPFLNSTVFAPSRYLYLASAGSSAIIAWTLQRAGLWMGTRANPQLGRAFFCCLTVALMVVSCLSLRKAEAYSYYGSGRSYIAANQIEVGIELLQRAIDKASDVIPIQFFYVSLVSQSISTGKDYWPVLQQALQTVPEDPKLQALVGALESMEADSITRQNGLAKIDQARLRAALKEEEFARMMAGIYHNLGKGLYQNGDYEKAIQAFEFSLTYLPDRLLTLKGLIRATYASGRYAEAVAQALEAVQVHPYDAEVLQTAVLALRAAGQRKQAAEMCRRALLVRPTADLYILWGEVLRELGNREEAITVFERGIEHAPDDPRLYLHLAEMWRVSGNHAKVIDLLERVVQIQPGDGEVYFLLGNQYYIVQQFDQAARAFREAARLNPRSIRSRANLGTALKALDRRREAEQAYLQAIAIGPDSSNENSQRTADYLHTSVTLGQLYRETEQPERALQVYRRLLNAAFPPISSDIYAEVGLEFYLLGALDASIAAYLQALQKDPDYPNAQFNLGLAYLSRGDVERARAAYARGVELFGAAAAEKIGAVDELKKLAARGIHADAARKILRTYWGEQ